MQYLNDAGASRNSLVAHLSGSSTCTGAGITAHSPTPVLALCRELLAAGLDPDTALDVYRAGTLALRVRSLREAAGLRVAPHGVGFQCLPPSTAAPPIARREVLCGATAVAAE